jgi:hypothetical protein
VKQSSCSPAGALQNALNSLLLPRFSLGALRARLDCFVAIGKRSDAVLSNGYASQ